jgi:hypothetical protein
LSDARSSLICAGWLPQDGLFDWNGHHCLQKANVASRGWLFIGFAWVRSSRGLRIDLWQGHDDLGNR